MPSRPRKYSPSSAAVAENVQDILATKGLTLYRASQQSVSLHGLSSPYFIPHNLYYDLRSGLFRPSIHQIFALSRISGYRVLDWLRVFGFDLEEITRLQVLLPSKRTTVLDTGLTDSKTWIPWLRDRVGDDAIPAIAPLSRLVEFKGFRQISSIRTDRQFVYAKVGHEDAFAFPDLVPGSIVRVDPAVTPDFAVREKSPPTDRIFLLEHSKGFCCCRLRILGNGVVLPYANGLPYSQVELRRPQEVRLWGAVDLELRPILDGDEPEIPKDLARRWKPLPLHAHESFGQLLKRTRRRLNLSVREAAGLSTTAAEFLKDDRYRTSPSSLSEYELRSDAPRDLRKVITLCSIYGLRFEWIMEGTGLDISDGDKESIPRRYLFGSEAPAPEIAETGTSISGFLQRLLEQCQNEFPFFLRNALGRFSDVAAPSLDDFFWVGGDRDPLHPYLSNALIVMVNRRRKAPFHYVSKPMWRQPIYILLKRDGEYLAACCSLENDNLVLHPYGPNFHRSEAFRYQQDAEVVGQVVAIAKRFR